MASLAFSSYLLISLIALSASSICFLEVSFLGFVTFDLRPAAASPNLQVWKVSPELLSAVEIQRINEENAVPSKQDFIILVMVDSFQAIPLGRS